ncbi:hypothetical protein OF83DRAFT_147026, partial [Amylostereum chailletii]
RRQQAFEKPLKQGHSFFFTFPPSDAGTLDALKEGRPLPSFPHKPGALLTVRLVQQLKGQHGLVWACIIEPCTADSDPQAAMASPASMEPTPDSKASQHIIAKFIQPSMLRHDLPDPRTRWWESYYPPRQLVHLEETAYKMLVSLQGKCIPRFYGAHKVTMPNEEEATMLVMEFVKGLSISQLWSGPYYFDLNRISVEQLQSTLVDAQHTLAKIHGLGVVHNDIHAGNIILSDFLEDGSINAGRRSFVFIDFGDCHMDVDTGSPVTPAGESDKLQILQWHEVERLTRAIALNYLPHKKAIRTWVKKGLPGIACWYTPTGIKGENNRPQMEPVGIRDRSGERFIESDDDSGDD